MPLTPTDVANKQFRIAFRGYSLDEVDAFLDEVETELSRLLRDNAGLKDGPGAPAAATGPAAAPAPLPLQGMQGQEAALRTLLLAQRTADEAIAEARAKVGNKVEFINSTFETVTLPRRYENIVLTHVLEHLDDPVLVLKRINDEWLSDDGRFFLVCPNANAPSRQIAVKMGLISHNSAVTPAEAEHGHRCTYTLDTLERDAVAAGLKVVHRSGIFFKALANFQWDRLLQTDIISNEYLDGCYKLGQQYPDLCSSIFLMCERGDAR